MGEDDESGLSEDPSRARRAKAVATLSLIVVAVACVAYLRPSAGPAPNPAATSPGFQLDAVDFVSPSAGWVLADLDGSQFAVLATTDAGRHWTTQLVAPSMRQGEYMRFFDARDGVVVTAGGDPVAFATRDGGATWARSEVFDVNSFAISASFSDPQHGWVLMDAGDGVPLRATALMRTVDGGATWTRLGETVVTLAQPFALTFTDAQHGWLDAVAPSAVAYATSDAGDSWHAVALPSPKDGWPTPRGSYFVAIRSTLEGGLVASVVNSTHVNGRNAAGSAVLSYPPLTVKTYDGGGPVVYVYGTFADTAYAGEATSNRSGPSQQAQAPNQVVMTSLDGGASWRVVAPPASGGTIGFASSVNWWWVGPGQRATTFDAGATWSPVTAGQLSDPVPGSLVVVDDHHAWISAMRNGMPFLFTTSDAGAHWSVVALPAPQALT